MVVPEPGEIANLVIRTASAVEQRDDSERADVRHRVGQQIEQHGALGDVVCRHERHEQIAAVRDARVGEHPFDVALRDADHRPHDHRRRGDRPHDRPPQAVQRLERGEEHADERRKRSRLYASRHETGDSRRSAFIRVGRPHVEWHRRDLERESHQQEADGKQLHRRRRHRLGGDQAPDAIEPGAAGQAVGKGDPVKKKRTRKRPEQKILEGRLGRGGRVAADAREHVDGERQHLQREKDDQEIGRCRHQHHAGDRKQQQRVVLALRQPVARDRRPGERERQESDDDQDPGDEQTEVVGRHDAEARGVVIPERGRGDACAREPDDAQRPDGYPLTRCAKCLCGHRGDRRRSDAQHRNERVERRQHYR